MIAHEIIIADRVISISLNPEIVQNGINADTLKIVKDNEWSVCDRIVVEFSNCGIKESIELDNQDAITIPHEVLNDIGKLHITVIGYKGSDIRLVTERMEYPFRVVESGIHYSSSHPSPTPDSISEVIDIRTGYDGHVYSSAGDAVRAQIQNIIDNPPTPSGGGMVEILYADLVALRNANNLQPGTWYRIIDYITTVHNTDFPAQTALHAFDVIVRADSANKLNENAFAAHSKRDTGGYFTYSRLQAWKLKYCLDNNQQRFKWADLSVGTGVIYEMIDEFGNRAGYDFKNIQFGRYKKTDLKYSGRYYGVGYFQEPAIEVGPTTMKWFYTFDFNGEDYSLNTYRNNGSGFIPKCFNNIIDNYYDGDAGENQKLNNVVFENLDGTSLNANNKILGRCHSITFGTGCRNNILNNCDTIYFGYFAFDNKIESASSHIFFGDDAYNNFIGYDSFEIRAEHRCENNKIGSHNRLNNLGNECLSNIFNDYCEYIDLGDNNEYNVFGYKCREIHLDDRNSFNNFGPKSFLPYDDETIDLNNSNITLGIEREYDWKWYDDEIDGDFTAYADFDYYNSASSKTIHLSVEFEIVYNSSSDPMETKTHTAEETITISAGEHISRRLKYYDMYATGSRYLDVYLNYIRYTVSWTEADGNEREIREEISV